ncbi:MAG: hypothetical protein CMJ24_06665 [Phycisphaerae bacterium]|nr:hypothetical protein [Phycisphaerae bacterium]
MKKILEVRGQQAQDILSTGEPLLHTGDSMDRTSADRLVRRARAQSNMMLVWMAIGYLVGFIALVVILLLEGAFDRWPGSLGEIAKLLGILFVVPIIFVIVFGVVFKLSVHRSAAWRFDHHVSQTTDVDMKSLYLLDAVEQVSEGGMSADDAALVQQELLLELSKSQKAGADSMCLAAYLRMLLEDHRSGSARTFTDDEYRPMLDLIAALETT